MFEIVSRNFEILINRNKSICGPNALSYELLKGVSRRPFICHVTKVYILPIVSHLLKQY